MKTPLYLLTCIFIGLFGCSNGQTITTNHYSPADHIVRIEMHLSAFGVESDDFPSIDAWIDFSHDTSLCVKSFYHPDYPGSTYRLTVAEMDSILKMLQLDDLEKLKPTYRVDKTDQPSSATNIYTTQREFSFYDYGLIGDAPLRNLYRIVYRY